MLASVWTDKEVTVSELTSASYVKQNKYRKVYRKILPELKTKKAQIAWPGAHEFLDISEVLLQSSVQFSSVQSLSHVQLFATLWIAARQASLSITNSQKFTQTHVHRVSDAIQPSHPRSSPSPPAPNPSQHQSLFQWVNSSHEVAKVLEFQL